MPDALDELNAKIEELCAVAERERERLLDGLCAYDPVQWDPNERQGIAALALDYAEWTRIAEGFRAQLRARERPVSVVK